MTFELQFTKSDLVDWITKMAVPIKGKRGKQTFHYPKIFPMIKPSEYNDKGGMLEWIVKSEVTTWVRVKYPHQITGLTKPTRISINVEQMLNWLKMFSSYDTIRFIHDEDNGIDILKNDRWDNSTEIELPICYDAPDPKIVFDGFPGALEPETEIILFKQGSLKPNISGSCDVSFIKEVVKIANDFNSKPMEWERQAAYNFLIDGELRQIKSVVVTAKQDVIIRSIIRSDIEGSGELRYTSVLADVINTLSGTFKFYTVNRGPLWIMKDTEKTKMRYLVLPAQRHP